MIAVADGFVTAKCESVTPFWKALIRSNRRRRRTLHIAGGENALVTWPGCLTNPAPSTARKTHATRKIASRTRIRCVITDRAGTHDREQRQSLHGTRRGVTASGALDSSAPAPDTTMRVNKELAMISGHRSSLNIWCA